MTPGFGFIIMLALAAIFYKAADFEDLPHPLLWAGLSLGLYAGATYGLHWGVCGALLLQILLFLGMTVVLALGRPRGAISLAGLRRKHRLRQNRCPECNYDLEGVVRPGQCPECGADVPRT